MSTELVAAAPAAGKERAVPYSDEAEKGVLGSILLDFSNVMDLCIAGQLVPESFYVPAHRLVYETMLEMSKEGAVIDLLTLSERLTRTGRIERVGGSAVLDRLIDSTPTAAHAAYYVDIVRQKHLLRCIIEAARNAETECYQSEEHAEALLGRVEQSFLEITERQHGAAIPWSSAVKETMENVEQWLVTRRGLTGVSTGFLNLDRRLLGLRPGEMIVLAARPAMGKTSLAMNIAENVALGKGDPDRRGRPVGVFSLEMAHGTLVLRMLCAHAGVSSFKLTGGYLPSASTHGKLMQAASVLSKAPILLDDTGGLDILELRARARRMWMRHKVELIIVDYLQLLHSKEYARQGRQIETAHISGNLKAMAKELNMPVLVVSQLSRAPEQRDKLGKPKLSDLRDSGAIEQDADVVCLLRRPCRYPEDEETGDELLAVVDVAKQRNGPIGEVRLNFEEEFTRFRDREVGVDGPEDVGRMVEVEEGDAEPE